MERHIDACWALVAVWGTLAWSGCVAGSVDATVHAHPAIRQDPVMQLLSRLPGGAQQCAGVRMAELDAARISQHRMLSEAEAWVWPEALTARAYATALQVGEDGVRSRVTWLDTAESAQIVKARLEQPVDSSGSGLRSQACEAPGCPGARVHIVSERLLRIELGPWEDRKTDTHVVDACVQQAGAQADAIEISARRWRRGSYAPRPLLSTRVIRHRESGAGITIRDHMQDATAARERLAQVSSALVAAPIGQRGRHGRQDQVVETVGWVPWEDLAMGLQDVERLGAADRLARMLGAVIPVEQLEDGELDVLREQVELRYRLSPLVAPAQRADLQREARELSARDVALQSERRGEQDAAASP